LKFGHSIAVISGMRVRSMRCHERVQSIVLTGSSLFQYITLFLNILINLLLVFKWVYQNGSSQ